MTRFDSKKLAVREARKLQKETGKLHSVTLTGNGYIVEQAQNDWMKRWQAYGDFMTSQAAKTS